MKTSSRLKIALLLTWSLGACLSTASHAASTPVPAAGTAAAPTVLATVNGTPITSDQFHAYVLLNTGGKDISLSDDQKKSVLSSMVDLELLSEAAQKAGVNNSPLVTQQLAMGQKDLLAKIGLWQYLTQHPVSDDAVKAAFDEKTKDMDLHQYKARHILVDSEAKATSIIGQLHKGASFATLAKKYSKDEGSAANGGDLGDWFSPETMVPEFSTALTSLKKGEYTQKPVHTQYGWHVIELEDVRIQPAPELDSQTRDQITKGLQQQSIQDYIKQLHASAQIQMPDAAPSAATNATQP